MANDTLFKRADLTVEMLLNEIQSGTTGLPELQRPFVWPDSKVRDLLNSMLKGYPIGFVITWESPNAIKAKQIGQVDHAYQNPNKLIIDGQQRLTSLFAVFKDVKVVDSDYRSKKITLSFNPLTCICEVWNASIAKSGEWISDISPELNSGETYKTVMAYTKRLEESRAKNGLTVTDEEKALIFKNISRLFDLGKYLIPTLDITSEADEEDVAQIFVAINSGGTKLNESDFILTLISVHWNGGRKMIEEFCEDTKKHNSQGRPDICNPILDLDPSDVIRASMAFGFKRARLRYAYKLLHGADFDKKGAISEELRDQRFEQFREFLSKTLDRANFAEFLKCVASAGYVKKELIGSKTNIVYAYAFYLIGKYEYGLSATELRKTISKLVFVITLSARYVGSFESRMEQDMANLPSEKNYEQFKAYFDRIAEQSLTSDFFSITLIGTDGLETTGTKSPAFLGYIASQNILDTRVLFSKPPISTVTLYNEWTNGTRKSVEVHHIFPKAYLRKKLDLTQKQYNQVANYAFIEWADNMDISEDAPSDYYPNQIKGFTEEEIKKMEAQHGLPHGWHLLAYEDFLSARRKLMADIVKQGYEKICALAE